MHVPESKRIMSLLIMLLTTSFVFAQVTVTGNVRDERGDEVIGATVLLIGSQHGVITDVDGNFKLNVPNAKTAVLQISYVGYETQKIALKGKTKISVTLAEVANALNEVMVVAYGTQKKETLTGAISSVKTDGLLRSPNASIASSLAGQVTGLSSVSTSGQPGKEDPSIYIRGVGSLTEGASSPLILVDGVERYLPDGPERNRKCHGIEGRIGNSCIRSTRCQWCYPGNHPSWSGRKGYNLYHFFRRCPTTYPYIKDGRQLHLRHLI